MTLHRTGSKILSIVLIFLLACLITVPAYAQTASSDIPESKYEPLDPANWSLVWSDEFNGSSVDTQKWEYTIGGGGFGNNEQQYYTDSSSNSFIRDDCLVLKAIPGTYGGENYTSAKLTSKVNWEYGRFEFRAKLPAGTGLWPAIWMLPANMNVYGGEWPICGEIDIMEYMGSDTDTVLGTLHYGNPWIYTSGYYNLAQGASFADDFHNFTMEWLPGEIRWYVDGSLYQIQQNWYSATETEAYPYPAPFNQEFCLMLNLAVGGFFPGNPNPADWTSNEFSIDYVRVYEYTGNLVETEQQTQQPNINLLSNSYFDASLSGWESWSENGASFSCVDGNMKVDIYTTLPNTWSTQFYQNVDMFNTTNYRLSFRAKSTAPRPIKVAIEGAHNAPLFSSTFNAGTEWNTYTYDFIPTASNPNSKLLFFLGNVDGTQNSNHTVYFDDIVLYPLPNEMVLNGDFSNNLNDWNTWTENGSEFAIIERDKYLSAMIPTILPNAWSAQLYQNVGPISAGTYRIVFDSKSSIDRQICVALEKDGVPSPLNRIGSINSNWKTLTYDFTVSSSLDVGKLVFMLGNVEGTPNVAHTVELDNISLYKLG